MFREVVGLARGPLNLMSTAAELLGRKSSGSSLETREYGLRDELRWPRGTLYPQKLTLTSPTSGGRSVSIVRSRTRATEFACLVYPNVFIYCLTTVSAAQNFTESNRRRVLNGPARVWNMGSWLNPRYEPCMIKRAEENLEKLLGSHCVGKHSKRGPFPPNTRHRMTQ
jgi:hypothetical protein